MSKLLSIFSTLLLVFTISLPAFSNPTGGTVVYGQATITNPNATTLNVHQISNQAIINWHSFNISNGETTNFVAPSAASTTLARVNNSSNPATIMGRLNANDQLFLVDAGGIFFGPTANVNVGSLVASTVGITNNSFLSYQYTFNNHPLQVATVVNQGNISTIPGGDVTLIGYNNKNNPYNNSPSPGVDNRGTISAKFINLLDSTSVVEDNAGLINSFVQPTQGLVSNEGTLNATDVLLAGPHVLAGGTFNVSNFAEFSPANLIIADTPGVNANQVDQISWQWAQKQSLISSMLGFEPTNTLNVNKITSSGGVVVVPVKLVMSAQNGINFADPTNTVVANSFSVAAGSFQAPSVAANANLANLYAINGDISIWSTNNVVLNNLTTINGNIHVTAYGDLNQIKGGVITANGGVSSFPFCPPFCIPIPQIELSAKDIGNQVDSNNIVIPVTINASRDAFVALRNVPGASGQVLNVNSIGNSTALTFSSEYMSSNANMTIRNFGTANNFTLDLNSMGDRGNVFNFGSIANTNVNLDGNSTVATFANVATGNVTNQLSIQSFGSDTGFFGSTTTLLPTLSYVANGSGDVLHFMAGEENQGNITQLNLSVLKDTTIGIQVGVFNLKYFDWTNQQESTNWPSADLNFIVR